MQHAGLASALLVLTLLASCAPIPIPTTLSPEQSPLMMSPSPTTQAPAPADATIRIEEKRQTGNMVIIYERDGGFAGTHDEWRFYADGHVEAKSEKDTARAWLPDGAVDNATQRIVANGFLDLSDEYMPDTRCCDRFTYRLTVIHDGTPKSVTTMDGAEQPPALAEALAVVQDLIRRATPAPQP